jgi:CubicO group peptidase (beta-lactamase class C family)
MHRHRPLLRPPVHVFAALATFAPVAGQDPPAAPDVVADEMAPLDELLNAAVEEVQFGGAVVIERAGTVLLQAGYGLADRERRIPFTPRTIAQVGSLTKQFTAMAVLDLWRRGRLGLNDPVSRHLPGVPGPLADRTIHQLLTHTAGLPEYCGLDFQRTTLEDLLACVEVEGAVSPAGSVSYSNAGYSVLAAVVESVSGMGLEAYLRDRFLVPLGMHRTGYHFPATPDTAFALGYGPGGAQRPISERITPMGDAWWHLKGNGGMQASAADMHRWSIALRHGPVIDDTMRAMAFSPHETRDPGVHAGYGWFVRTDENGIFRISHTGSDGVFYAAALWYPRSDTFVYFVGNSGEQRTLGVLRRLLAELGS